MSEKEIIQIIKKDAWMMGILEATKNLRLPDWWIGAGFVRSKVWDTLHGYKKRTPLPDIDVIYFDKKDYSQKELFADSTEAETVYEQRLSKSPFNVKWSVTNQARMHVFHNDPPYKNSAEGLAHWVETATCIGVTIDIHGALVLVAPHGIADLTDLIVRPTYWKNTQMADFRTRVNSKKWLEKWPKLQILEK